MKNYLVFTLWSWEKTYTQTQALNIIGFCIGAGLVSFSFLLAYFFGALYTSCMLLGSYLLSNILVFDGFAYKNKEGIKIFSLLCVIF